MSTQLPANPKLLAEITVGAEVKVKPGVSDTYYSGRTGTVVGIDLQDLSFPYRVKLTNGVTVAFNGHELERISPTVTDLPVPGFTVWVDEQFFFNEYEPPIGSKRTYQVTSLVRDSGLYFICFLNAQGERAIIASDSPHFSGFNWGGNLGINP